MVEIADIRDVASLERWLASNVPDRLPEHVKPDHFLQMLAARAALRALPVYWKAALDAEPRPGDRSCMLPLLRLAQLLVASNEFGSLGWHRWSAALNNARHEARSALVAMSDILGTDSEEYKRADAAGYGVVKAGDLLVFLEQDQISSRQIEDISRVVFVVLEGLEYDVTFEVRGDIDLLCQSGGQCGPLWQGSDPNLARWAEIRGALLRDANWAFWLWWYQGLLDGTAPPPDDPMLVEIALLGSKVWENPEQALPEIRRIWEKHLAEREPQGKSDIASASLFDFVEMNRRLRAVGFPSDLSPFDDPSLKTAFLEDASDLKAELQDWCDYVRDATPGLNRPPAALRAAEKVIAQLEILEDGENVTLRRLVSLGSDLRRFSMAQEKRAELGDTLSEMLDERVDDYTRVANQHFGKVFLAWEPLQRLELGTHSSEGLIADVRAALARMEQVSDSEMPELEPETQAVLTDMLRELDDWSAEIQDSGGGARSEVLRKRFAEKYGGFSATYGRYLEKGAEIAEAGGKRFDGAVKWYRRWNTLEKIVDWWQNLPPPS